MLQPLCKKLKKFIKGTGVHWLIMQSTAIKIIGTDVVLV